MNHWLMKTEPDECSIDDVLAAPRRITPWTGVRNYQARNYMRDQMRIGDGVLFYHSSCPQPGVAGLAEVASAPYVDPSQFDRKSPYCDPKSRKDAPRWFCVDVRALKKTRLMPLAEMHAQTALKKMLALRPGNRLSITPVTATEWKLVCSLLLDRRA
jgi:predicted RNA-binding protein with PUA-like domain